MKNLRNIIIILIAGMSILSSCKKELDVMEEDNANTTASKITDIIVSNDFDWKTTKDINVSLILPSDKGLMRTKIMSEDGSKLFYQGYPNDTTSRSLETKITIPSYMNTIKVSNGITESIVDVTSGELSYNFSGSSFKNTVGADCDECDGGITKLELEYVGEVSNPTIKVTQKKGSDQNYVIYEGTPQGAFEFIGADNKDKMGAKIKLYVNDEYVLEMHVSCSVDIYAGMTFGDFYIISGISEKGGALCDVDGGGNEDCGECDGQITELELEYVGGSSNPTIKVTQKKGGNHNYVIYEGTPQGAFDFIGANNHDKMGAKIKVYVNDVMNVEIHTSCSVTILAGMIFGDFLIVSGTSDNGGALCDVEEEDDSHAGTVIYEDLYPAKGDYDFNDLVVNYNFDINKSYNDYVETIEATFTVRAFGASYHNAFGFQFATVTPNDIASVTGTVLKPNTIFNFSSNGTEQNQSKATFIVYDDAYGIMQHPGEGIGVNTTPGAPYVEPVTITLTIVFEPNTVTYNDLDIGNLNPFIVMKQNRGYEVHLANFEPTDLFDTSLYGVYDDDSNASIGRYFKTDRNLPWAVNIPDNFQYMNEKAVISSGYLKFVAWAESEGAVHADWYMDLNGYRNEANIYQ